MEKILFGIVGWNIAETTRMIEVAKIFKNQYECHFFSYGGKFEKVVTDEGFILHRLEPLEDDRKIDQLWRIDRGESLKQPWTVIELRQRINNEVKLINELRPKFAFLGSVLTFSISCKLTKLKLFNFVPLALSRPYLKAGLPISPFVYPIFNKLAINILLKVPLLMGNIRRVCNELGLKKPDNALELWEGDINIVAESEELTLLKKLPEKWYFSGPLFADLKYSIPDNVKKILNSSKRKAYFAMGSSASREKLLKILNALSKIDVQFIAPIKSHLIDGDIIPPNVLVTDWLPALEICKNVDFAITHGGQGTVQTNALAGIPFIGIGMQPEQELNIYLYYKFGSAIQIQKNRINQKVISGACNEIINNQKYKQNALEAKKVLERTNTKEIIKQIVNDNILL
jgi:UDP:flavonoid glycosyltransferase YjiC (YdhE family)